MNFNFKNVKKVEVVFDNEQGELIEKLKLTSISEVKSIILTDENFIFDNKSIVNSHFKLATKKFSFLFKIFSDIFWL